MKNCLVIEPVFVNYCFPRDITNRGTEVAGLFRCDVVAEDVHVVGCSSGAKRHGTEHSADTHNHDFLALTAKPLSYRVKV